MKKGASAFEKRIKDLSWWLNAIVLGIIVVLMCLTVADVTGRYLFNNPVRGTFELSQVGMAAIVFLGLGYTTALGRHIRVELFVNRFPLRMQGIIDSFTSLLVIAVCIGIAWQGTKLAIESIKVAATTDVLNVPIYPFKFLVPLGALVMGLNIVVSLISSLSQARKGTT